MSADAPLRRLPGAPRVLLRSDGGRRARFTRALTGGSDWRRELVDTAAFARVAAAGTAGLPDTPGWPWPDLGPEQIEDALRHDHPALRILGAVVPRQAGRSRLSLLCRSGGTLLVIKLGADPAPLRAEHRALELLAADPLPGIATPHPFGFGLLAHPARAASIAFVAASALGVRAQRPAIDAPLLLFERDLGRRLAMLPKPQDAPPDLVPVHGDLTPWNLRRTGRGLALFDWESVGWGPPGSDLAHYRRASAAIRRPWQRPPAAG